jgi:hypothetical protein
MSIEALPVRHPLWRRRSYDDAKISGRSEDPLQVGEPRAGCPSPGQLDIAVAAPDDSLDHLAAQDRDAPLGPGWSPFGQADDVR